MEIRLKSEPVPRDIERYRPRLVTPAPANHRRTQRSLEVLPAPVPACAKWSYVTRNVDPAAIQAAEVLRDHVPQAGDLILAQVERIAQHTRIQLSSGRRSQLFPGDHVVVAYGNRYAPDQFEAEVPENLDHCHLVASGGIAARALSKYGRLKWPTTLKPAGYLLDVERRVLNLARFSRATDIEIDHRPLIAVAGTSMNAGKTTAVAALVKGLSQAGHRVAAVKVTGTGAGNDMWAYEDAGAAVTMDFTDAGYPSTYKLAAGDIEDCYRRLVATVSARADVDVVVVEIADGLLHAESMNLLVSDLFRSSCRHLLFAAGEAMGAMAGVQMLRAADVPVVGVSGVLSASRLASREAEAATGLPVYTRAELESADIGKILL